MRTVKMTLDPELVDAVDKAARRLGTTRSAFTRRALREALKQASLRASEKKQRLGYAKRPVRRGEFDCWESEQVWTD
ncbi:MAG TPA: CopG family transcriptional regulator [Vicinamibacteria bacterium]|nr:CopG family transcriptional regulator [Vicinamibacteria bacterium]